MDCRIRGEHEHEAGRDEGDPTNGFERPPLRLGRDPGRSAAQRRSRVDRPDQGRRGGGDDRARTRHDPRRRPQVAQERVPDRSDRGTCVGAVYRVDNRPAPDAQPNQQQDRGHRDAYAQLHDRATAVRRERERRRDEDDGHDPKQPCEQPDVVRSAGGRAADAADVARGDVDPAALLLHALRQRGADHLQPGSHERVDVRDCERECVLVAVEHRPVDIPHTRPEGSCEGAAAHYPRDDGLDDWPRRDQVALFREHDVVGDALGDEGADAVVLECHRGPVGELIGVDGHPAHVSGQQSEQDRERREDDERQHANVPPVSGHLPTVPLRAMSFHVRPSRYY